VTASPFLQFKLKQKLKGEGNNMVCCLQIDVWAAGVILYILLCGFPPFVSTNNDQEELFDHILTGHYEFSSPYWDEVSISAKDLIAHMLQVQPELRFSAEDVLDHLWLAVSLYAMLHCSLIHRVMETVTY
jgi:serine/threonine protein kinase